MIKKIHYSLLVFCFYACQSNLGDKTIIRIEANNTNDEPISVVNNTFSYKNRLKNDYKESYVLTDTISLANSGYYKLYYKQSSIPLYLEKGKSTFISFDGDDIFNTISFSEDLKNENNYLLSKQKLQNKLNENNIHSLNEELFLAKLFSYKNNILNLLENDVFSISFVEQEIKEINYEIAAEQILYPQIHAHIIGENTDVSKDLDSDFYSGLKSINFTDTLLYSTSQTSRYPQLVKLYFDKKAQDNVNKYGGNQVLSFLAEVDKLFPHGNVKDDLFNFKLRYGIKNEPNLDEIFNLYVTAVTNTKDIEHITTQYLSLKKLNKGEYAPNFELENLENKLISLNSFKGNYVYIDVWATWCAPCIAEFPALAEIIKKYKNIKFISISIDKKKDSKKLRSFIEDYNLTNTQLIAYDNSNFQKNYAIGSIPRFILIDKEGKIISIDAPKPSSTEIELLLNSLK